MNDAAHVLLAVDWFSVKEKHCGSVVCFPCHKVAILDATWAASITLSCAWNFGLIPSAPEVFARKERHLALTFACGYGCTWFGPMRFRPASLRSERLEQRGRFGLMMTYDCINQVGHGGTCNLCGPVELQSIPSIMNQYLYYLTRLSHFSTGYVADIAVLLSVLCAVDWAQPGRAWRALVCILWPRRKRRPDVGIGSEGQVWCEESFNPSFRKDIDFRCVISIHFLFLPKMLHRQRQHWCGESEHKEKRLKQTAGVLINLCTPTLYIFILCLGMKLTLKLTACNVTPGGQGAGWSSFRSLFLWVGSSSDLKLTL